MISKTITRAAAFLLLPCLLIDPSFASGFASTSELSRNASVAEARSFFSQAALMEPVLASNTIESRIGNPQINYESLLNQERARHRGLSQAAWERILSPIVLIAAIASIVAILNTSGWTHRQVHRSTVGKPQSYFLRWDFPQKDPSGSDPLGRPGTYFTRVLTPEESELLLRQKTWQFTLQPLDGHDILDFQIFVHMTNGKISKLTSGHRTLRSPWTSQGGDKELSTIGVLQDERKIAVVFVSAPTLEDPAAPIDKIVVQVNGQPESNPRPTPDKEKVTLDLTGILNVHPKKPRRPVSLLQTSLSITPAQEVVATPLKTTDDVKKAEDMLNWVYFWAGSEQRDPEYLDAIKNPELKMFLSKLGAYRERNSSSYITYDKKLVITAEGTPDHAINRKLGFDVLFGKNHETVIVDVKNRRFVFVGTYNPKTTYYTFKASVGPRPPTKSVTPSVHVPPEMLQAA